MTERQRLVAAIRGNPALVSRLLLVAEPTTHSSPIASTDDAYAAVAPPPKRTDTMNTNENHRATAFAIQDAILKAPTYGNITAQENFFYRADPVQLEGFAEWCEENAETMMDSDPEWRTASPERIRYTWARLARTRLRICAR